ncbi:peptidase M24, structural domain-containing protein [Mucor mucedo]|uniref:peptidase M24, structural domain-containing protein n=1 Tax=Mucor mucedo TaxID=29922 RepID=UPI00221EEB98|nr:peptidase M24, structural domain-containing protein [Mucor mucedo]KAI7891395.1 peptidase M24, structural domain-containing protein [Mucor mucedo]
MNISNDSFPLPQRLPTRSNYLKVKENLAPISTGALLYLRGGVTHTRDDTDVEVDFRQESNFFYLSGIEKAGYHILVALAIDKIFLIPPTVSPDEQLWKGIPDSFTELLKKYDADFVLTEKQLPQFIADIDPRVIFTLDTTDVSAIPKEYHGKLDKSRLRIAINEARLIKLPWEISILRYSARISSHAHMSLMSLVGSKNKSLYNEAELEANFRWTCARNGLARQCYIPIVASGPRAAVLHYTDNDRLIPDKSPHTLILVDAGGEYKCYGSDITRTFPLHGKFTEEAKTIYNIVLKAQNAVLKLIGPGVLWRDMHNLVVRVLCYELVRIGILVGHAYELMKLGVYRAFYFHGTGHSVGLDCHDVGGSGIGILTHQIKKGRKGVTLDLNRALEKDMVVTVEPGLYFNDVSIDIWTKNPAYARYFNMEKINQYRVIGGVRIEDTILITDDGHENFTIAPKEVQDIEALMKH